MATKDGKYPEWQKSIREAQAKVKAATQERDAKAEAERIAKLRAEHERMAAGFKRAMEMCALPVPKDGETSLEIDGFRFAIERYNERKLQERVVGSEPAVTSPRPGGIANYPTEEVERITFRITVTMVCPDDISAEDIDTVEADPYYFGDRGLPVRDIYVDDYDVRKGLGHTKAGIADCIDELMQETPKAVESIRAWKKQRAEAEKKQAEEAAKPKPQSSEKPLPLPTPGDKLADLIRDMVREMLEAERNY